MTKRVAKKAENVVEFFGKKRKLNALGEFKLGRMRVRVGPEHVGKEARWFAELSSTNRSAADISVSVGGERSGVTALRELERQLMMFRRFLGDQQVQAVRAAHSSSKGDARS